MSVGEFKVHMLDVGYQEYGDCILCEIGPTRILIDGSHPGDESPSRGFPSIPNQLEQLYGHPAPFDLSLLVITHAHRDHYGCLPQLVADGTLRTEWALLADPDLGWGRLGTDPHDETGVLRSLSPPVRRIVAALREESPSPDTDD